MHFRSLSRFTIGLAALCNCCPFQQRISAPFAPKSALDVAAELNVALLYVRQLSA
jgi:hypothetical protein